MSVPVIIISGFLGAGKTSLLKRFLQKPEGLRIALVKNEFTDTTDLSFEEPLLIDERDTEAFETYLELPNSCVCCSAKTQIEQAVARLVTKGREEGRPFDLVLLELAGVADPSVLADNMMSAADTETDVLRYGGMICVVDATALLDRKSMESAVDRECLKGHDVPLLEMIFTKQLACAELILLNKCDLLTSEERADELVQILHQTNPAARIVKCTHSDVSVAHLKDLSTMSEHTLSDDIEREEGLHTHKGMLPYDIQLETYTFRFASDLIFDPEVLDEKLSRYLWDLEDRAGDVYRGKGLLRRSAEGQMCSLQTVRSSVEIRNCNMGGASEVSRFLFICSGVPKNDLHVLLRECVRKA